MKKEWINPNACELAVVMTKGGKEGFPFEAGITVDSAKKYTLEDWYKMGGAHSNNTPPPDNIAAVLKS